MFKIDHSLDITLYMIEDLNNLIYAYVIISFPEDMYAFLLFFVFLKLYLDKS